MKRSTKNTSSCICWISKIFSLKIIFTPILRYRAGPHSCTPAFSPWPNLLKLSLWRVLQIICNQDLQWYWPVVWCSLHAIGWNKVKQYSFPNTYIRAIKKLLTFLRVDFSTEKSLFPWSVSCKNLCTPNPYEIFLPEVFTSVSNSTYPTMNPLSFPANLFFICFLTLRMAHLQPPNSPNYVNVISH